MAFSKSISAYTGQMSSLPSPSPQKSYFLNWLIIVEYNKYLDDIFPKRDARSTNIYNWIEMSLLCRSLMCLKGCSYGILGVLNSDNFWENKLAIRPRGQRYNTPRVYGGVKPGTSILKPRSNAIQWGSPSSRRITHVHSKNTWFSTLKGKNNIVCNQVGRHYNKWY